MILKQMYSGETIKMHRARWPSMNKRMLDRQVKRSERVEGLGMSLLNLKVTMTMLVISPALLPW